jgi:phage-related protein
MKQKVTAEGAASEMAAARMAGLNGAMEGLQSAVETLLLQIGTPFLGALTGVARQLVEVVNGVMTLDPQLRNAAIAFAAVLAAAGPLALAIGGVTAAAALLLTPFGAVVVAAAALAAGAALLGVTFEDVDDAFDALGTTVHNLLPALAGLATAATGLAVIWATQNTAMLAALVNQQLYTARTAAMTVATHAFSAAQAVLNVVLAANPIGLVVVAIAALVAILVTAYNTNEDFRNSVDAAWAAIQEAATVVFPAIDAALTDFFNALADGIIQVALFGREVGAAFSAVEQQGQEGLAGWGLLFETMGTIAHNAMMGIVETITSLWGGVPEDIRADLELIIADLIDRGAAMLAAVGETWNGIVEAVGGAMSALGTTIHDGWVAATTIVGTAMQAIDAAIREGWSGLSAIVSAAMTAIGTAVRDGWDTVSGAVNAAMTTIGSAIQTAWNGFVTTISGVISQIIGVVEGWRTDLEAALRNLASVVVAAAQEIGRAIVQGIIDGARNMVGAVGDAMTGVVRSGLQAAKDALDIKSPSGVFRDEVGVPIVLGIIEGIEQTESVLLGTIDGLATTIIGTIQGADMSGAGQDAGASVVIGVISGIEQQTPAMASALSTSMNSVKAVAYQKGTEIADVLKERAQVMTSSFGDGVSGMAQFVDAQLAAIRQAAAAMQPINIPIQYGGTGNVGYQPGNLGNIGGIPPLTGPGNVGPNGNLLIVNPNNNVVPTPGGGGGITLPTGNDLAAQQRALALEWADDIASAFPAIFPSGPVGARLAAELAPLLSGGQYQNLDQIVAYAFQNGGDWAAGTQALISDLRSSASFWIPPGGAQNYDGPVFLGGGGIVTRPTLSVIGEAGPEAVIPLSQLGGRGAQGGEVHMHVHFDGPTYGILDFERKVDQVFRDRMRNGAFRDLLN